MRTAAFIVMALAVFVVVDVLLQEADVDAVLAGVLALPVGVVTGLLILPPQRGR